MNANYDNEKFMLPAGKVNSPEDLDRQLGIERKENLILNFLSLLVGIVIGALLAVVAGLSYPHWKHIF